jgi:hypothetical protein
MRIFRMERLPHVLLNICAFPRKLGSASSYMTIQPLYLNFLLYEENFFFFFVSVW